MAALIKCLRSFPSRIPVVYLSFWDAEYKLWEDLPLLGPTFREEWDRPYPLTPLPLSLHRKDRSTKSYMYTKSQILDLPTRKNVNVTAISMHMLPVYSEMAQQIQSSLPFEHLLLPWRVGQPTVMPMQLPLKLRHPSRPDWSSTSWSALQLTGSRIVVRYCYL